MISNFGNIKRTNCMLLSIKITNKMCQINIHRLVAIFFVEGKTLERNVINHIDENKLNYNIFNLEWCTFTENVKHSIHKRFKKVKKIDPITNETIIVFDNMLNAAKSIGVKNSTNISRDCADPNKIAYKFK